MHLALDKVTPGSFLVGEEESPMRAASFCFQAHSLGRRELERAAVVPRGLALAALSCTRQAQLLFGFIAGIKPACSLQPLHRCGITIHAVGLLQMLIPAK